MNENTVQIFDRQEIEFLLNIAEVIQLKYAISTGILQLVKDGTMIYEGTLTEWQNHWAASFTDERQASNFLSFCTDLRAGKEKFVYHLRNNGTEYVCFCSAKTYNAEEFVYGVLKKEKLTDKNDLQFRRASDKDPMLDMLNKRAITEYAKRTIESGNSETTYLVILDLDNFKAVNDNFGHMQGDEVLACVTDILKKAVGNRGVIGRLGGDEILIVTKGIPDKAELRIVLREIRSTVEATYKGKWDGISLTCSMGAAAYPDHAEDYKSVMEIADKMLYLAKEKGRNRYLIYTPELHEDLIHDPGKSNENALNSVLTYNKTGMIKYMLEDFLFRRSSSNEVMFSQIGNAFHLNEILTVYSDSKICFRWTPESVSHNDSDLKWIEPDDVFYSRFNEDDLFIVDGLYALSEKAPELKEKLMQRNIQSALFYRLKNKGNLDGFLMFAKKFQRQKWSQYEILALSTVSKIFEISIYGVK